MVYYFHVRRIQNLLQIIIAQGFPAWAEEGISRATGVVRLILILVQNDREGKKKRKKEDISVLAPPGCAEDCCSVTLCPHVDICPHKNMSPVPGRYIRAIYLLPGVKCGSEAKREKGAWQGSEKRGQLL